MKAELVEKLRELQQILLTIPKSKRKAAIQKGLELAALKQERDDLIASTRTEGKMDSAVPRTTSVDGVAQTSKTPGGQPGSTMA